MNTIRKYLASKSVLFFSLLLSASVDANDFLAEETPRDNSIRGFFGAGYGYLNEYEGADSYRSLPFFAGRAHKENRYVELIGLGARANLLNHKNWQFGPALRYRFGRDDDVDNAQVAQLDAVDNAIEAGVFLRFDSETGFRPRDSLGLEMNVLQDISDGHEGYVISLGLNYNTPVTRKLRIGFDISTSYASDDYMQSYYSISDVESVRSGISQFGAEAGIKDLSFGFGAQYGFTDRWGIFSRVSYQRLLGDAADSTIVNEQGDANQFLLGVGITYRF